MGDDVERVSYAAAGAFWRSGGKMGGKSLQTGGYEVIFPPLMVRVLTQLPSLPRVAGRATRGILFAPGARDVKVVLMCETGHGSFEEIQPFWFRGEAEEAA